MWNCGRPLDEDHKMFEWIAGILTIGLLAYLAVALLKPEWFA
jgi:K+-transporting ATPase KdpF subunit